MNKIVQYDFFAILHQLCFFGMGVGKAARQGELLRCCVLSETVIGNLGCAQFNSQLQQNCDDLFTISLALEVRADGNVSDRPFSRF